MAQFDVYRTASGDLLLDCQTDLLSHLNTRLVVPLLPVEDALCGPRRLNPVFRIGDDAFVMSTEFAAAVPARELRSKIISLGDDYLIIESALDYLISGY